VNIPPQLHFTASHEWARSENDGSVTVGITHHAQETLGDIVYVALPDVGRNMAMGETLGEVESTKSVNEVYAPIAGTIVAVNGDLDGSPELVNSDPYGAGWFVRIAPSDPAAIDALLDAAGYEAHIA